jgi:mycothiol synthase
VADDVADDRFDHGRPSPTDLLALALIDDRPVAALTGSVTDGQAELEALVEPTIAGTNTAVDALVALADALAPAMADSGASRLQLWARPTSADHEAAAARLGASPTRSLHQMRCQLPVAAEPLSSRPYHHPDDLAAVRLVNNRAFASHPSQGGQTEADLRATMSESWFDPDGLRLHERDGRVAGFCWTRVHAARSPATGSTHSTEAVGEIFVIGIDPDFHGQGLGVPMTAAGLDWLNRQGLTRGMLYVETTNTPAVRTYERLGFSVARTDAAWAGPLPASTKGRS